MGSASRDVAGITRLAATTARRSAMTGLNARHAVSLAKAAAVIRDAASLVTSPVYRVPKRSAGLAALTHGVRCLARRHVTGYHVLGGVRSC